MHGDRFVIQLTITVVSQKFGYQFADRNEHLSELGELVFFEGAVSPSVAIHFIYSTSAADIYLFVPG